MVAVSASGKVFLRALKPDDLEFLYVWENTPEVWQYGDCGAAACDADAGSDCMERFSREQLRELTENQQYNIGVTGQLRLVICRRDDDVQVGFIDLFDFDPAGLSAGVGILICDPADRCKGYGSEALKLMLGYARQGLGMREVWCTVDADNTASLSLFSRAGFVRADDDTTISKETLWRKTL